MISFPLMLDRDAGFAAAVITSLNVVRRNPLEMAVWGLAVAVILALASLPFFIGLAVAMPVLGHATWHLYRAAVDPATGPRAEYHPGEKARRYAADFPAVLFTRRGR